MAKVLHGPRGHHAKHALMLQAVAPIAPRIRTDALPAGTCFGRAGRDGYRRQAAR